MSGPAPTSAPASAPTWTTIGSGWDSFKESVKSIPEKVTNQFTNSSQGVKDFLTKNAFNISGAAALAGGGLAVNSTINLIKNRGQFNLAKEITKVAAGVGITAMSIYAVNEHEKKLTVGLVAAISGLTVALIRIATDSPVSVRSFILKKRDSQIAAKVHGDVSPEGDLVVSRVSVFVADQAE